MNLHDTKKVKTFIELCKRDLELSKSIQYEIEEAYVSVFAAKHPDCNLIETRKTAKEASELALKNILD